MLQIIPLRAHPAPRLRCLTMVVIAAIVLAIQCMKLPGELVRCRAQTFVCGGVAQDPVSVRSHLGTSSSCLLTT
jgi:hypothetical protein